MFKNLLKPTNYTSKFMHTHTKTSSGYKPYTNIKPIIFDVSLRDGLQGANPLDFPTFKKSEILHEIHQKYTPAKLEIGSFVSPKVLPIMSDTAKLLKMVHSSVRDTTDIYALVPNKIGLLNAILSGFTNFSFITSVSNAFQVKNTGKPLSHKKLELTEMTQYIKTLNPPITPFRIAQLVNAQSAAHSSLITAPKGGVLNEKMCKTKLYISCVKECPINGMIDSDFIIHEILSSYGLVDEYDELCISDTMGTLKSRDFEYIVDGLIRFGVTSSRISIHLHINKENEKEAKQILFACFQRNINRFDVSVISDGGCSVTMDADKLKPNMTYDFLYSTLEEYKETF